MTIEQRLVSLEDRFNNLQESFITSQIVNNHYIESNFKTSEQVKRNTSYQETKIAYYGEKEKGFYNVPFGNTSVFFSNYSGDYRITRIENMVRVYFNELTDSTEVTIMVQKKED